MRNSDARRPWIRDYAFNNKIINSFEYLASQSAEIGGLLGMAGKLLDDENAETPSWSVQPHVESKWVAGDSAELMAAFSPVSSSQVVQDSRKQPGARLLDIGENRMLLIFLDDDSTRPETQASVLKYAIYNTKTEHWDVTPTAIQNDGTGDYMPAISEMTVSCGYNGLAVYAYTVDKDLDPSSSDGKELYIQFYDFASHSTYVPIRLTNDSVSQTMPTLTRAGDGCHAMGCKRRPLPRQR